MSTDLIILRGKYEYVKDIQNREVGYKNAELHVASFYGGEKRRICIQMAIISEKVNHIQITKDEAIRLRNSLNEWLK